MSYDPIGERSAATPGLWNRRFESIISGGWSNSTDYLSIGTSTKRVITAGTDAASAATAALTVHGIAGGPTVLFKVSADKLQGVGPAEIFTVENNEPVSSATFEGFDMNFRNVTMNIGDTSASASSIAVAVFRGPTGDTTNPIQVRQVGSAASSAFVVGRTGGISLYPYTTASFALNVGDSASGNFYFRVEGQRGDLVWSAPPGGGNSDVSISRSTNSTLKLSAESIDFSGARFLSIRTVASLGSTNMAVGEIGFSINASGASLAIRSNGTIYYFTSSASTRG